MISQVKLLVYPPNQISTMEDNINYLIKIGWQPLGELKIIKVDRNDVLMQQLTKGEDK